VRRPRTATRPTKASKRRRVDAKKRRGEIKRGRRRPAED
jgi:ribosome-associated protein